MPEDGRTDLRSKLIARLQRVRGQIPDAEFNELVNDVERVARRFAEINARLATPPGAMDALAPPADEGAEGSPGTE